MVEGSNVLGSLAPQRSLPPGTDANPRQPIGWIGLRWSRREIGPGAVHLLDHILVAAYPDPGERAHASYWLGWLANKMSTQPNGPIREFWWQIRAGFPVGESGSLARLSVGSQLE
jgi:hypothetical protein